MTISIILPFTEKYRDSYWSCLIFLFQIRWVEIQKKNRKIVSKKELQNHTTVQRLRIELCIIPSYANWVQKPKRITFSY